MEQEKYNLVIQGKILDGFDKQKAKEAYQGFSGLGAAQVDELFRGEEAICKRDLDREQAERQRTLYLEKGIACRLQAVNTEIMEHTSGDIKKNGKEPLLPFIFSGKAGEFFRIWIVNLLLTIITIGFYLPWAKVRTNRYFYGSTTLDGNSFSYLAAPITILKGYLVAIVFFVLYIVVSQLHPVAELVMPLILIALFPWILVRSLRFKAWNSSFRNIRFGFDGSVINAYKVFLLWPVLALVSMGVLFPHMIYKQKSYLFNGFRYGKTSFRFDETARPFWRLYLMVFGMFVAVFILIAAVSAVAHFTGLAISPNMITFLLIAGSLVVYFLLIAFIVVRETNIVYNAICLKEHRLQSNYEMISWIKLQLGNMAGVLLSLGLLIPWARIRSARYRAQHTSLLAAGNLNQFIAAEQKKASAIGEEAGDLFDMDIAI